MVNQKSRRERMEQLAYRGHWSGIIAIVVGAILLGRTWGIPGMEYSVGIIILGIGFLALSKYLTYALKHILPRD